MWPAGFASAATSVASCQGHARLARWNNHDSRHAVAVLPEAPPMPMNSARSESLFAEAQRHLPGGVNSPVRAFRAVGGTPRFVERARGCRLWDVDGNEYIDYVCSWGPLIAGHAHPHVVAAIQRAAERGTSYGAPTE